MILGEITYESNVASGYVEIFLHLPIVYELIHSIETNTLIDLN